MSYPFVRMPTLAEFVEEAKKHGALDILSDWRLHGPRGPTAIRYLIRDGSRVIIPEIGENDRLTPNTVSHWCRRLKLDPGVFGLSMDGLPPEDFT